MLSQHYRISPFSASCLPHTHGTLAPLLLCFVFPPAVPQALHSSPPTLHAPVVASAASSPAPEDDSPYPHTLFGTCSQTQANTNLNEHCLILHNSCQIPQNISEIFQNRVVFSIKINQIYLESFNGSSLFPSIAYLCLHLLAYKLALLSQNKDLHLRGNVG